MSVYVIDPKTGRIEERNHPYFWVFLAGCLLYGALQSCSEEPQKEFDNVKKYCSAQQLPKTGHKACDDAKAKLLNRYKKELKEAKNTLESKQNATARLVERQQQQCSANNIKQYGNTTCDKAKQNLMNNKKSIDATIKKINEYEQKIINLNNLNVNGTHIVSTEILNIRSCPKTECDVIGKLKYGDSIFMQEDMNGWVKFENNGIIGYVSKKFLWDNRRENVTNK